MKKLYYHLLKNPLWFNKRKKIVERDGNKCTVCGSAKKLEVHHTFYYRDKPVPWKYPDNSLLTLCHKCHVKYHKEHKIEIKDRTIKKTKQMFKKKIVVEKKKQKVSSKRKSKICLATQQSKAPRYKSRVV